MTTLTELTLQELTKMTKDQLIAGILEGQTYMEEDPLVKDEFGNNVEHGWRVRDSLTGNLISSHRVTWSYYDAKAGIVDEITVQEGNRQQVIKHFTDGKQPTVKTELVAEPILIPLKR